MSFTKADIIAACQKFGPLLVGLPSGVNGIQFLWALSGNESSFGEDVVPRHEPAYDLGGSLSHSPEMQALLAKFPHAAACSYGPWQIMLINCPQGTTPDAMTDLDTCAQATVAYWNRLLREFHPQSISSLGMIWNAGSPLSHPEPGVHKYMADIVHNYQGPLAA
jgi:hypothetical protein